MTSRPSTEQMRRSLKLATRAAVAAAGTAAAIVANKFVRVKEPALSIYASFDEEHQNRSVPMDIALDLDFVAGEPYHARALAVAQGYELKLMKPVVSCGLLCLSDISRLATEYHETQASMFEAVEDNHIGPVEAIAILQRLDDLDLMTRQIRTKVEACAIGAVNT